LVGARDPELSSSLLNARRSDAHIVVVLERRADQALQRRILKNFRPFLIAQGGIALRGRGVGLVIL
jgi:hypothetical protein